MAFENFPYTNFHEINLDWIVAKVKEAYSASNPPDYPVKSVNGMTGDVIIAIPANLVQSVNGETGDVILYRNPLVQFPTTDESRWNLFRICDGDARGIEFDEDGAKRIEGTRRILIYDEENQPDFPVTSVNGQTGDVRITAGVNSVNGKTGNVVTPFTNPNADILTLDSNSNTVLWGISRQVAGGNAALYITTGAGTPQAFIRYTPTGGQAINLPLLTNADIPTEAGVVSVNTKSGVVTLYGTDILLDELSGESLTTAIVQEISQRTNEFAQMQTDISSLIKSIGKGTPASGLIENGGLATNNGTAAVNNNYCRTINYVDRNCLMIAGAQEYLRFSLYAYNKTDGTYVGRYWRDGTFKPTYSSTQIVYFNNEINMRSFFNEFPDYDFKVIITIAPDASTIDGPTRVEDLTDLEFIYSWPEINANDIEDLQETVSGYDQQISALQAANVTQDQRLSSLESNDDTQDQQISALQAANSTHNQQISELQSADAAHNQQISALQTKETTQDQQISELYTRTGIYAVSIANANTLPLRYPTSGTDEKIKDTNKVVSMDLSLPGAQMSDWTITTYDGYLEITGTINGITDITLYLA